MWEHHNSKITKQISLIEHSILSKFKFLKIYSFILNKKIVTNKLFTELNKNSKLAKNINSRAYYKNPLLKNNYCFCIGLKTYKTKFLECCYLAMDHLKKIVE